MGQEIKVGEALLNYSDDMAKIQANLEEAFENVKSILLELQNDEIYYGKAKDEMLLFYNSLQLHIDKMNLFYKVGGMMLEQIYQDFSNSEQQLCKQINNL